MTKAQMTINYQQTFWFAYYLHLARSHAAMLIFERM
jgi:hypothetical protein